MHKHLFDQFFFFSSLQEVSIVVIIIVVVVLLCALRRLDKQPGFSFPCPFHGSSLTFSTYQAFKHMHPISNIKNNILSKKK